MSINASTSAIVPSPFWTPDRLHAFLDRSAAKSDEQARAGNLPRLVRRTLGEAVCTVASRIQMGTYYLLTVSRDGEMVCDCPASDGRCWHKVHLHRALAGDIGLLARPTAPRLDVSQLDVMALSGRRAG